jgi:hypothetical protein
VSAGQEAAEPAVVQRVGGEPGPVVGWAPRPLGGERHPDREGCSAGCSRLALELGGGAGGRDTSTPARLDLISDGKTPL